MSKEGFALVQPTNLNLALDVMTTALITHFVFNFELTKYFYFLSWWRNIAVTVERLHL